MTTMHDHDESPAMWLVRHGQSTWNALGWAQGQSDDALLTRRGYRQAYDLIDCLRTEPVDVVYSSDLRRAHQTASIIAQGLGSQLVIDERLRERRLGLAVGSQLADLGSEESGILDGRVADIDAHAVGGESLRDLSLRCQGFLEWVVAQGHRQDFVVVAHGGSIRMLEAAATRQEIADMPWHVVPHASARRIPLPQLALSSAVSGVSSTTRNWRDQ